MIHNSVMTKNIQMRPHAWLKYPGPKYKVRPWPHDGGCVHPSSAMQGFLGFIGMYSAGKMFRIKKANNKFQNPELRN